MKDPTHNSGDVKPAARHAVYGDVVPFGIYTNPHLPIQSRVLMFVAARQGPPGRGCSIGPTKMARCFGCKPHALRVTLGRMTKSGALTRVTWDEGRRWGYRVGIEIPDDPLEAINDISGPWKEACRPEELNEVRDRIQDRFNSHKEMPGVYNSVEKDEVDNLLARDHWLALNDLWLVEGFNTLLDLSNKDSVGWWLSLISNVRMNRSPWAEGLDGDLLLQVGMLNAADHIMRKVRDGEWHPKKPSGLFCTILQTLDKRGDTLSLVDSDDVEEDMKTLATTNQTVRQVWDGMQWKEMG